MCSNKLWRSNIMPSLLLIIQKLLIELRNYFTEKKSSNRKRIFFKNSYKVWRNSLTSVIGGILIFGKFHEGICEMWISWGFLLYCNAFRKSVLVFIYNHLTLLLAGVIASRLKKASEKMLYNIKFQYKPIYPLAYATRRGATLLQRHTMGQDRQKCKETLSHSEYYKFWIFWS